MSGPEENRYEIDLSRRVDLPADPAPGPSGEERREAGTAYLLRFTRDEEVGHGATRILTSLVDEMVGYLDDPSAVGVDISIHEVRRRGKQARALVRLIRPAIPTGYQDLNRLFRDAGRLLADARDARVMVETFADLAEEGITEADRAAKAVLAARAEEPAAALFEGDPSVAASARALLVEAGNRARELEAPVDATSLVAGATSTYRAGRKAFRRASANPTPTTFHTWRKRVKDHRHQIAFLWECDPVEPAVHDLMYELSDALGAANDLAVLGSRLGEVSDRPHGSIDRRRHAFERSALQFGGSLYHVKPKEFSVSLATRWEDWR